jgi:hypothetical protein
MMNRIEEEEDRVDWGEYVKIIKSQLKRRARVFLMLRQSIYVQVQFFKEGTDELSNEIVTYPLNSHLKTFLLLM